MKTIGTSTTAEVTAIARYAAIRRLLEDGEAATGVSERIMGASMYREPVHRQAVDRDPMIDRGDLRLWSTANSEGDASCLSESTSRPSERVRRSPRPLLASAQVAALAAT